MSDLDALIAELEKAKVGSRELDGKVGRAVGVTPKKRDVYKRGHYAGGKPVLLRVADVWPPFTTSLDAAVLMLVPENHDWIIANVNGHMGGTPFACVGSEERSFANDPILAFNIAALKARRAMEKG